MRIAASIQGFVVQFDTRDHLFQLRHRPQNICALGGVRLHDLEFFRGQSAWLFENAVLNSYFADVMQLGGDADSLEKVFRHSHFLRDQN